MDWTQLRVKCKVAQLDEVSAVMSMLDNYLMTEDYSDIEDGPGKMYGELIDESILASDKSIAHVSIFLSEDKILTDYMSFLDGRFKELGLECEMEAKPVREEDWANSWKAYYTPVKISDRVTIVPAWDEDYQKREDEVTVLMDPGMAFGTGTHETTRLCAALLEKHMKAGDSVLDIGTGSGILSIIASKLGAHHVDAYDIDPVAVKVAIENVERNETPNVKCGVSDLFAEVQGSYDFICANIVADILVRMADGLAEHVKLGTKVVASGIIEGQVDRVNEVITQRGFKLIDSKGENSWSALVFEKI